MRTPAEVFPVGDFIQEEMQARGWSMDELIYRMGGDPITELTVTLLISLTALGRLRQHEKGEMNRKTIFSPCRQYRYTLWRDWGSDLLCDMQPCDACNMAKSYAMDNAIVKAHHT